MFVGMYDNVRLTVLEDHSHRSALVQNSELALGALLVCGVGEDTSVQQRPVGVCNHGTDVSRAVWLSALLLWHLERVAPLVHRVGPEDRVTLVDRVDGALLRHAHVGVGEDELAEGIVHGEAVDGAVLHGQDQLGTGAVHGEAGGDQLGTGLEEILFCALGALFQLEDSEDGAD